MRAIMSHSMRTGAVVLFLSVTFAGCKKVSDFFPRAATQKKTITKIVSTSPNFTLLEAAVKHAGLAETLDGEGPFTVFAPTDDAFRAAGFKTKADIDAVPAETLKGIILYHALGAAVYAGAIPEADNTEVSSLFDGKSLYVTRKGWDVCVNGVQVVTKDIKAKNGVIHAIDRVLFPPTGTVVDAVAGNPDFSILLQAVIKAGASGTDVAALLSGDGPFTVFAPTNQAFSNLLTTLGVASLDDIPVATLLAVLQYHVVPARVFSCNLSDGLEAPTALPGATLTIGLSGGATVTGSGNSNPSNIIQTDLVTTNGVIHVIDQVLLP